MPQDNSIPLQPFQGESPVDNYLKSYYDAKQQKRTEQSAIQQDKLGQQNLQLNDMKLHQERLSALNDILASVPDGDAQALEVAKQRALSNPNLGLKPEDVASFTIADLPGLKIKTGQAAQMLDLESKRAAIAASRASTQHSLAATRDLQNKPQVVPTKVPNGYQYVIGEDGKPSLQFIPGGPADPSNKPLTKEQTDAAGFFSRLRMADGRLSTPEVAKELMSGYNSTVAPIPLGIGNALVSETYQQGDQAKRDLINAQLRRESGAAIGSSEFSNADQQYVPTYGDKPAVLDQKNVARKLAIYNMAVAAGPQYKQDAEDARKAYIEAVRQQSENDAKRKAAGGKTDAPATDPSKWTVTKVGK